MTGKAHSRGIRLMIASTLCFVANVLLIRALGQLQSVNVWLISCARFIVGLSVVFTVFRRDIRPRNLFQNGRLIMRGIVGGLGVGVYYLTVVRLGAGRATFINTTYII